MPEAPSKPGRSRSSLRPASRAALKASVLLVIAICTAAFGYRFACGSRAASGERQRAPGTPAVSASGAAPALGPARRQPLPDLPDDVRYLFVGGGSVPESTEVSLEQDLLLAQKVLPGPGAALFAGGAGSKSVRQLDGSTSRTDLLARLGDLFQPRSGRTSRYRAARVPTRPATEAEVRRALSRYLSKDGAPLTLIVAAHGERGARARDNFIALWGDGALSVGELAEIHAAGKRPLRLVSGACFSGGFAELAFESADEEQGAPEVPRCGLFASTWDREASGCDPNPDRRAQQSYLLHVLHALAGKDRHGNPLPDPELDLNADGEVGMLEAHTRARTHSGSIDVPTTTSERWLRARQRVRGDKARELLPEDARVVDVLSAALGLEDEAAAKRRLAALQDELAALDERLSDLEADVDEAFRALRTEILSDYPVLDDPYHPGFRRTLADHRAGISAILDSAEGRAFDRSRRVLSELDDKYSDVLATEALVQRLVRAHETLALVGGLVRRGGTALSTYRKLLACERGAP